MDHNGILSFLPDYLSVGVVVCRSGYFYYTNTKADEILHTNTPTDQLLEQWHFNDILYPKPWRVATSDGTFQVSVSTTNFHNNAAYVYTIVDVSECIVAENKYALLNDYFNALTDIGVLAIDSEKKITYANITSCKEDNISFEEVKGMDFSTLFPTIENSPLLYSLETGSPVEHRELTHNDPSIARQISNCYPIIKDGEVTGAVSLLFFNKWINRMLTKTAKIHAEYNSRQPQKTASYTFDDILGISPEINRAKKIAMRICNLPSSVLIYGETGTGKELFAQSIHNSSSRNTRPFIAINCAAIPETLLESTLFGTKKGAFTGALTNAGLIEQCMDGTLFLDEINSMPIELQVKLLRVLQENSYRRVGDSTLRKVQCRILSACNQPPEKCIKSGTLREDLFYRLAAIQIDIPPLRDRTEDILLLAEKQITKLSELYGIKPELSPEVKEIFQNYNWPGNVRELNHIIESILALTEHEKIIHVSDLPAILRNQAPHSNMNTIRTKKTGLKNNLSDYEHDRILTALESNNWNVSKTAKSIGYSRSNLQYRMKKLGIERKK